MSVQSVAMGIAIFLVAGLAQGSVISVTGEIATSGSNYNFTKNLLDAQPATDPVAGDTTTDTGSAFGIAGSDPALVFDFGTDFATKTFHEVYLLEGTYGSSSFTADYFWSPDKDPTFESGEADVVATDLGLFNYTGGYSNSTEGRWRLLYSNPAGITPQAQYLIVNATSASLGNFIYETAFVNTIPEPATLSLMLVALGGLVVAHRFRR